MMRGFRGALAIAMTCTCVALSAAPAAIDEAHRRGLKATGHLCSVTYPEDIALGVDDPEHGFFVNTQLDLGKKPADLVVLKGDPAHAINDIENVETVFKDGVGYDTAALLASVRGHYGEY
jgi:hypothetical protein